MDPITIATAASIVKALGLDKAVGRWLGGDKGAEVAGKVLDAAQVVTGARSADDIIATLKQSEQAELTLRQRLLELDAEESERDRQDRASARAMQIAALQQEDPFSKRFVYYFAAAWSLFAMGYLLLITLYAIPESAQRYADTTLGFLLGTIIATIVAYFFGSSRASAGKDQNISALAEAVRSQIK
ncbi:hypothetical protein [Pseudomonas sp. SO81]|uniref:hypothetical protein n=1 Tax=Pseudomonas sp. SO81 TaxID=2983246 RepID=UPI0025A47D2C|nr:hypothetical protein [Pseudomonas sp. SO81]WJN61346.1 hypothetical protein OH686_21595 [Pseudomonas sp. SO81]